MAGRGAYPGDPFGGLGGGTNALALEPHPCAASGASASRCRTAQGLAGGITADAADRLSFRIDRGGFASSRRTCQ